jgi:hypothetical protein
MLKGIEPLQRNSRTCSQAAKIPVDELPRFAQFGGDFAALRFCVFARGLA